MVLSTTISQRCWTDVHLFAMSHGKSVSEVVEALLVLGATQAPYQAFYAEWYGQNTPEATFEQIARGREKLVPARPPEPAAPDSLDRTRR